MKVKGCIIKNFASYKELEFNFNDQGLALVHGPTGSGKSTLCDVIPWTLFGRTSKGGTVDEVLSWPATEVAKVTLYLDNVTIHRSRGPNHKDNDLMFWPTDGVVTRGKDIPDTQKLINSFLGVNVDLYLAGAYFHEFSQTAQFFTTTAKNRRTICEQLVDLSLPIKLQDGVKLQTKEVNAALQELDKEINNYTNTINHLEKLYKDQNNRRLDWEMNWLKKCMDLDAKSKSFQQDKDRRLVQLRLEANQLNIHSDNHYKALIEEQTESLPEDKCKECGAPYDNAKRQLVLHNIDKLKQHRTTNQYNLKLLDNIRSQIARVEEQVNTYGDQLEALKIEVNPYEQTAEKARLDMRAQHAGLQQAKEQTSSLNLELADLETLSDIVQDLRSILIKNSILSLESETNRLLERHFDAEIKIELQIQESDKLEVNIQKDGNVASFTQLSKGQRQLLKLCFGVAVMKSISNHHGIKFEQIFLDECMEGLDECMKLKAMGLLEALSLDHSSVFFVDHSEAIKAMSNKRYKVELVNGNSQIEEDNG